VAFSSLASNLLPGDVAAKRDVFVADAATGAIRLITRGYAGDEANGDSFVVSISRDGRYVLIGSSASNLVPDDFNAQQDFFVIDTLAIGN
jgi:hypothetical protein